MKNQDPNINDEVVVRLIDRIGCQRLIQNGAIKVPITKDQLA